MTDYSLDDKHIHHFDQQGFIPLPQQIPPLLFHRVYKALNTLIDELGNSIDNDTNRHRIYLSHSKHNNQQQFLYRINDLMAFQLPETLLLLGCPQLLHVVESLCGAGALPVYESIVFHHRESNGRVKLHQDMIHDRSSRIITAGIYLDEAAENDGCLRALPGYQNQQQDINQLEAALQSNQLKMESIFAKPGDLVLHDVMVPHDVQRMSTREQRKTIYIEFRSLDHLNNNPRFSDEWIVKRKALVTLAKQKHADFDNNKSIDLTPQERDFLTSIQNTPLQIEPANYALPDGLY